MAKTILTKAMANGITKGHLQVIFADGSKESFGSKGDGGPDVTMRFTDARVPWEILKDADLGMGEAFMHGRMVFDKGDIMEFAKLLRTNNRFEDTGGSLSASLSSRILSKTRVRWQQFNSRVRARQNAAHHYDIGNAMYELMLDAEHMQYSCAYWPRDDMTLAEAQEAKLAHIASKLALADGQEILDIGSGWGGMAIYLAKRFNVRVTGITLAKEQVALARERAEAAGVSDRVTFELKDFRDLAGQGARYDRIVSVGMLEHVGKAQFDPFFAVCREVLKTDGVMLVHTIGRMGSPGLTDRFTSKYIFPGGYIPALSETVESSEKYRLIMTDTETLRVHYAKTIQQWYDNCLANREAIIEMFDEAFFRMWTLYLAGAATVFEDGGMCNYQIQYVRDRRALPLTRDYLAEAEAGLLNPA